VKCAAFAQVHWWTLPVEAEVDAEVWQTVKRKLGTMPPRTA
jgi:hypothetical protein